MFKGIAQDIWVFDAEWAPDPLAGRVLYELPESMSDAEVLHAMFQRGGATEENPTPFLKVALCQVVSVVAVVRRVSDGKVSLSLNSLPRRGDKSIETDILSGFLGGIGRFKPQLVGYNSLGSDIKIFLQRAVIKGVPVPDFVRRPEKPWLGADYFAKGNEYHLDLYQMLHFWGSGGPSLNEVCRLSGIPGKLDCDGQQVYSLWLEGRLAEIVGYNECDSLSTYLLWLRCAYVSGYFDEGQYQEEQDRVRALIESEITKGALHLQQFLDEWARLGRVTGQL